MASSSIQTIIIIVITVFRTLNTFNDTNSFYSIISAGARGSATACALQLAVRNITEEIYREQWTLNILFRSVNERWLMDFSSFISNSIRSMHVISFLIHGNGAQMNMTTHTHTKLPKKLIEFIRSFISFHLKLVCDTIFFFLLSTYIWTFVCFVCPILSSTKTWNVFMHDSTISVY